MDLNAETEASALAESVVLADPKDLQALAALHARFLGLGDSFRGNHAVAVASLCGRARSGIERIIMEEAKEPAAEWAAVGECAACLQALLCDGREPGELAMPGGMQPAVIDGDAGVEEGEEDVPDGDPDLVSDFVRESLEHLEASDVILMALDSGASDPEAVNALFRAFHTIKGVAGFLGFKSVQAFAHGTENLLDRVRLGEIALDRELIDLAFAAVEALRKRVQWVGSHGGSAAAEGIAAELRAVSERVQAASAGKVASPPAAAAGPHPPEWTAVATAPERKAAPEGTATALRETVKVEAERLDRLLDAIGELVIAESMILQSHEIKAIRSPLLAKRMAALDKITRDLQKMGTSLRMVPIRPVFQKMAKLARDLARKAGKSVEFHCQGEETELDKTVVDKIGDPLVHMVRNSVDHGIETDPSLRAKEGKPARARVELRAFQKGGNVCIRIQDDGKGLDREAILRKARDRGLLEGDGSGLADQDVWKYIFEAGFSTASQVTEISGRGVGMDVVRRNIEDLRGRIEIDSVAGKGTTFSIWLPLTLAIIDGMIVRVGRQRLVFPTLSILRIVPLRPEEVRSFRDRGEMLLLQGELIPLFELSGYVPDEGDGPAPAAKPLAVIVESGNRKAGLLVDELIGQQQVVIKGLGETLKRLPGLSGGAILSDGAVGMILDPDGLLQELKAAPAAA